MAIPVEPAQTTTDDATVTITLLDVNEAPDVRCRASGRVPTQAHDDPGRILKGWRPTDLRKALALTTMWTAPYTVSTYTVSDPEGVVISDGKWSLSGDDAARFQLTGSTGQCTRTLEFREKADFENANGRRTMDNVYEVTVVASDGVEMAERAVTVKITDSDEAGMITLSSENPVTGTADNGHPGRLGRRRHQPRYGQWYALTDAQVAE